ncbi:efflux transporter, HAE1 family, inner membrane component [Myxococcus xanthus DK 1622]|uniref:Efflux transporter, HAE1 family, inner membrane component n=1 Tax=Myxococcus xanthus (strain DK1622) TaxID=246197 RepID=Q1D2D6_MYXXD|nr:MULTISPECIES: multidrug efflux RND transporter permease subunit [Myxococcus]ABF90288.1 efflux transporter, HAE1 family, inner membrane component [Myxococcus xanthus DK 1622]NOJ56670.1 multidrug efflux RND transporter permease subunit [Myxococcus xanthus]QPM77547.1 multidrug efflux RND transporter permease subunit [Myxococcus xanthus]QVW66614.1 multidrug efflux RND transporter permease subunit [Myxococcus xanthus DZ2]QZZ52696.1 Efflux pump membrane transporter BepE [Myxococcus xanthus]
MFVDFFIRRPVFAIVCSILLTLVGLIAIPTLPIAQYPDLAPPQVTVTSTYVGASAEVVESAVTIPLEQELNGVEGMRYITSTSSNDGTSQITITFEATRDIEVAAVDVQNRVSRAAARLPSQVNQTGIVVNKASSQMLLTVGLFSEDNRYDAKFLSNYADVSLKDAIKRVPGVGDVRIFGERKFSMRLWLDPTELARRKLTPQDVTRALQEQNLQVAAGQIGQPPSTEDQPYQIAVRARGRLVEPAEFGDIVLMRDTDGTSIRVKDVGRVELGAENYGSVLRFNGKTGVGLGIFQLPTANALDVRDGVYAELERLSKQFPPGMQFQTGTDTTLAVRASINEVIKTLVEAIVLVILVIFLFLHGWRSVLITAFTLPVSLIGTFAFVHLMGFSINTLTLFGLTLATGLVVDDAIVVIENIERLMVERRLSPVQAAREGMKEVTGAVIAISVVLVAVFVPVALFPGTTGAIYRQFALTIAASVALSTFCALTLTPALSAKMLKHHEGPKWVFFRWVDTVLDGTKALYGRGLRKLLKHPVLVLLAFLACIGGTALLFRAAPTGFIPDEDQGYLIISIQGPEGMSLAQTEKVLAEAEAVLQAQPEVRAMFAIGGFSMMGSGPNMGTIFSSLTSWEERKGKDQSVAALVERLRAPLSRIGGARVMPFQPPAIRGVGSVGGFQYIVEDIDGTSSLDDLAAATQMLVAKANEHEQLRGAFSTFNADTPLLDVEVDRQKAKALGVPIEQVFGTMQVYMGSQYVNDFNYANRTYRVYVQAEQQFRDSPSDIGAFYVRSDTGDMIPLESLVKVEPTVSAQVIRHYNLFRSAEINGQPAPDVSSGQALEAMETLATQHLPQGMSAEWTGISLEQKESGGQTAIIFALGLLFVFLVLAAQYESFSLPLVIIFSVPLAIMGALGLQLARGFANDVFCQVGLVMLVGLASKNAILIVEFAEQLREGGKSAIDAVVEAAEVRLRPILMTSIAFLLGVVPLMTASGAGAASRNSLGTAVFGGMLVSTVVNFVFIPGLYVLMQKLRGDAKRATGEDEAVPTPAASH